MDKNLLIKRVSQYIGWGALGISLLLGALFYIQLGSDAGVSANTDRLMVWTFILVGITMIFAFVVGPVISIISDPNSLVKALVSVGILAIIVLIAYSLSNNDPSSVNILVKIDEQKLMKQLTFTDTGLYTLYIISALAVLAALVSEVKNLLKL